MNAKFKQLALEAKMGTADFDAGSYYVATPDRMQLFAELIVRECAGIVKFTPTGVPHATIINIILEHFEVKL